MRMWNINPSKMCRQHLLGEHFELHKLIGNLKNSRTWGESLTARGFLEPQNALKRHNTIVCEMENRGFNHKSPLKVGKVKLPKGKVDVDKSMSDLKKRCPECRKRLR